MLDMHNGMLAVLLVGLVSLPGCSGAQKTDRTTALKWVLMGEIHPVKTPRWLSGEAKTVWHLGELRIPISSISGPPMEIEEFLEFRERLTQRLDGIQDRMEGNPPRSDGSEGYRAGRLIGLLYGKAPPEE